MLRGILNSRQQHRVLLLTDGHFSNSLITNFKQGFTSFPNLIMRTVATGADADLVKLKKMSTNESVYLPENISAAVDSVCFGTDERVACPETVNKIQLQKTIRNVRGLG